MHFVYQNDIRLYYKVFVISISRSFEAEYLYLPHMKEGYTPTPIELTRSVASPRLERGVIFMAEPGIAEKIETPKTSVSPTHPPLAAERVGVSSQAVQESPEAKAAALRATWEKFLSPDELKNPDTQETIRAAIQMGISPEVVTSKGQVTQEAGEVMKRTMFTDKTRVQEAKTLLGKDTEGALTKEQEEAIIAAHNVGKGEKGKNASLSAGVYNYTREQLAEKAKILEQAGFTKEERRVLMEAGIVGELVREDYLNEDVKAVADAFNKALADLPPGGRETLSIDKYKGFIKQAEDIAYPGFEIDTTAPLEVQAAEEEKRKQAKELLREIEQNCYDRDHRPHGYYYSLTWDDFAMLNSKKSERHDEFVNKWIDILYSAAQVKDPSESTSYKAVQRAREEVSTYLVSLGSDLENGKKSGYIGNLFEVRMALMYMRGSISTKSMENIVKASSSLRAEGLLYGMSLDKGYTGAMLSRLDELMEDTRVKAERGNLTPEMVAKVQTQLINESMQYTGRTYDESTNTWSEEVNKETAVGLHAGKTYSEVRRSVLAAYDLFVDSHRQSVITARGDKLPGSRSYLSDVGWEFRIFNLEKNFLSKYEVPNITDEKMLRLMKDSMVKDWLHKKEDDGIHVRHNLTREEQDVLGDLLFKDIAAPSDFFSSGWRNKPMYDRTKEYFEIFGVPEGFSGTPEEYANHFSTFMRIQSEDDDAKREHLWEIANTYRPEEAIRLLRQKFNTEEIAELNGKVFSPLKEVVDKRVYGYDEFKEEFGSAIKVVREHYMSLRPDKAGPRKGIPQQVNFAAMTTEQRAMLIKTLGGGEAGEQKARIISDVYKNMQDYLHEKHVGDSKHGIFATDHRFVDTYTRSLVINDTLWDIMETPPEKDATGKRTDMIAVSRKWAMGVGSDVLVRCNGDIAQAEQMGDAILEFVQAGSMEKKLEAGVKVGQLATFNGRSAQARTIYHTIIPFMEASMVPYWAEILGIENLPFRMPLTEIQEIYGPHAKNLDAESRQHTFDEIEAMLKTATQAQKQDKKDEIIKKYEGSEYAHLSHAAKEAMIEAELHHEFHKIDHKANAFEHHAKELLRITTGDMISTKIIRATLLVMAAAFVSAALAATSVATEQVSGGGGGGGSGHGGGH